MSLTEHLLTSDPPAYTRATQSPFLSAAAAGTLPRPLLAKWLANDRLYIHAYIQGTGLFLSALQLPSVITSSRPTDSANLLLDWAIEALVNVRREEKFFLETASEHVIDIDLPVQASDGCVPDAAKLDGLRRFESLFGNVAGHGNSVILPWLEDAVLFWATEKCYLDAWSWAKAQVKPKKDGEGEDVLRDKFIPNWTSPEFAAFVDRLGKIIDEAVAREIKLHGEGVKNRLYSRAQAQWKEILLAEETFWPKLQK